MSRRRFYRRFFEKFRATWTLIQRKKSKSVHLETPLQFLFYKIEIIMPEFELIVAEENKLENWAKYEKVAVPGKYGVWKHWGKERQSKSLTSKNTLKLDYFRCWFKLKSHSPCFWWNMILNTEKKNFKRFYVGRFGISGYWCKKQKL